MSVQAKNVSKVHHNLPSISTTPLFDVKEFMRVNQSGTKDAIYNCGDLPQSTHYNGTFTGKQLSPLAQARRVALPIVSMASTIVPDPILMSK